MKNTTAPFEKPLEIARSEERLVLNDTYFAAARNVINAVRQYLEYEKSYR